MSSDTIGKEAEVSNHSEIFVRDVAGDSFNEIKNRHSFSLMRFRIMIQKDKRDRITIIRFDSGFGERRFF